MVVFSTFTPSFTECSLETVVNRHNLRIDFVEGLIVFVITKTKRGLCFRNYETLRPLNLPLNVT